MVSMIILTSMFGRSHYRILGKVAHTENVTMHQWWGTTRGSDEIVIHHEKSLMGGPDGISSLMHRYISSLSGVAELHMVAATWYINIFLLSQKLNDPPLCLSHLGCWKQHSNTIYWHFRDWSKIDQLFLWIYKIQVSTKITVSHEVTIRLGDPNLISWFARSSASGGADWDLKMLVAWLHGRK